jgi:hypothetical protein
MHFGYKNSFPSLQFNLCWLMIISCSAWKCVLNENNANIMYIVRIKSAVNTSVYILWFFARLLVISKIQYHFCIARVVFPEDLATISIKHKWILVLEGREHTNTLLLLLRIYSLTSPTSGGRSVGIVRLRTKGHGVLVYYVILPRDWVWL